MKVEIEIPDLEEVYCGDYEDVSGKDLKKTIVDIALDKYIEQLYHSSMSEMGYSTITKEIKEVVKEHTDEIVNSVIARITQEILRKKAIVAEMPRKSEVANINKEWEDYFIELIDKAIAKRFRD